MTPDAKELAWAAGLFEGEGCFSAGPLGYVTATLSMTDEDSVRRFAAAVGMGTVNLIGSNPSRAPHWKPAWRWQVNGFERTQAILAMLWYGLGSRRRARAVELLEKSPFTPRRVRCRHGHDLVGDNIYIAPSKPTTRQCRTCMRNASRKYRRNVNGRKTHCPQGHPFDETNTYTPPTGGRYCRKCMNAHSRNWKARNPDWRVRA